MLEQHLGAAGPIETLRAVTDPPTKPTEPTSQAEKLERLYALIDGIETAMMTTRCRDGSLVSRPMQVQARDAGTDLWFMTLVGSDKTQEIAFDPQVNLGFATSGAREWVSVSGLARVTKNRERIHQLYKPAWKLWLPEEGGDRNGGPDDPRIALIEVEARSATFMKSTEPGVVQAFKMGVALLTGTQPDLGEVGTVGSATLADGPPRAT